MINADTVHRDISTAVTIETTTVMINTGTVLLNMAKTVVKHIKVQLNVTITPEPAQVAMKHIKGQPETAQVAMKHIKGQPETAQALQKAIPDVKHVVISTTRNPI